MSEKVGGQSVRLTPGEQGCLEKTNGYMTKREVDTYLHTAWKDGRIVFRNMRLEDLFYHPCPLVRLGGVLSESGGEGHPVYG